MLIDLTIKESKELRRLGQCLNSGIIPFSELRDFINGLQQKLETSAVPKESQRNNKKSERVMKYKMKLRVA
jgi:hypothetical protein